MSLSNEPQNCEFSINSVVLLRKYIVIQPLEAIGHLTYELRETVIRSNFFKKIILTAIKHKISYIYLMVLKISYESHSNINDKIIHQTSTTLTYV